MPKKIDVLDREVRLTGVNDQDYVCLTDIARYKETIQTDDLIRNWLRNRNTLEFLGLMGQINTPGEKGNIRNQATAAQLVCLSNLENLNALFIGEGLRQAERLTRLKQIAISQMKLLSTDERAPQLPEGKKAE